MGEPGGRGVTLKYQLRPGRSLKTHHYLGQRSAPKVPQEPQDRWWWWGWVLVCESCRELRPLFVFKEKVFFK